MGSGGAPCGACKFLRRKCVKGCVYAPYFCSEEMGASHFSAIYKVFGASNFSKLLMHVPIQQRYDVVGSVLYEAEARLQDPVYGCVSHIYALQQQVENLKGKLAVGYAQLASCGNSEGASLSPEYAYGEQSETLSLTSNSNTTSSYDKQYLNPSGEPQEIRSDNVEINKYTEQAREDEGSWSSFSVCMQGGIQSLCTSQEMELAGCCSSDGASLCPEYGYSKQPETPSLTWNSNSSSPYDKQYLNPWGDPQQMRSDNVAIDSYSEEATEDEGSCSSFSVCMEGGFHSLSTAQEIDVFQDAERLCEQRYPNKKQDGDLEDLVLALL